MKYVAIGLLLSLLGSVVALVIWDVHMVADVTGMIGLVFLVLSMIMSGAFVSGDRVRLNAATETDKGREERNRLVTRSLLIALPNLVVMLGFYLFI
ncbi:DUF5316 domain-containing protein [Solibacillus sp. FSL H8-0523]|uniref:DUF5316 domain-containing protein n=1 Tax=Solibacillus sp. FSL H8-0523 TaxID=2954511 RepID=UPI003101818D